jgi:hypothetical protein
MGKFSRMTWPALLAQHVGLEYDCHARPGSGNLQIAERIFNQLTDDQSCFYIIDWTWIDRFDYIDPNRKWDDLWQPWSTIMPSGSDDKDEMYFKNLHSEYKDKFSSLLTIKCVIDTLKQKGINFLMTYEDELMFDTQWNTSPAVQALQQYVLSYMQTFDGLGFVNWAKKNNFPVSATWHPLEQAHQAAKNYMLDFLIDKIQTS